MSSAHDREIVRKMRIVFSEGPQDAQGRLFLLALLEHERAFGPGRPFHPQTIKDLLGHNDDYAVMRLFRRYYENGWLWELGIDENSVDGFWTICEERGIA